MNGTVVNRESFKEMVNCIRQYDPFTQYIDNFTQYEQARETNAFVEKWFRDIMLEYGKEVNHIPYNLENRGDELESELTKWLEGIGLTVEQEAPKQKRTWRQEEIKQLIQTNDKVLYGALKKLYAEQTTDEQRCGETTHHNGVGFNGADSKFLSSVARFLEKKGFLTDNQKAVVRRKLVKYTGQLTRLANA